MSTISVQEQLLDLLPEIVFRLDRKGRLIYANPAFEEFAGQSLDGIGDRWKKFYAPGTAPDPDAFFKALEKKDDRTITFETPLKLADGREVFIEVRCKLLMPEDGTSPELIGTIRDRTDEVVARRELEQSETRFRRLAEVSPVAIYRADPEGRFTYLSKHWADKVGTKVDELLGYGWQKHLIDKDGYEKDPPWKGFTPENRTRTRTSRLRTEDGEILEYQVVNQAEFSKDGKLTGFVGLLFDISEQAKIWRKYQISESRFSALASIPIVGIFRVDASGRLIHGNESFCNMVGLSLEDAKDSGWIRAVHPEDIDRGRVAWEKMVADGQGQANFRFLHEDGSVRYVDVIATTEEKFMDGPHGFVGVMIDTTQEKETLVKLRRREDQLARLAANSRDPIFRVDLEGRCIYASPAATYMLGRRPRDLIGLSMIERCHPDDRDTFMAAFNALASGKRNRAEVLYRASPLTAPDDYYWLEGQGRLVRDAAGTPQEIVVSLRDVSERRGMERELREAKEVAEYAARSKSTFLANMSHEIRTPMNGVIGYADLLAKSDLTEQQQEYVDLIGDSGRAMMRILNDVLDLSKAEADRMQLVEHDLEIEHVMRGPIKLMRPLFEEKGIDLSLKIADDVPRWLRGDRVRLRQILNNLLANSLKFTARGSVAVEVEKVGEGLKICVRDTGPGVASDRLESIFEGFVQEHVDTHQNYGGTGLGLAISRSLARLMGGDLTVSSDVGVGSTFCLRLPLLEGKPPLTQAADKTTPDPLALDFEGQVLVAEDHHVNQMLISAMLQRVGVKFDMAGDGEDAIARVHEARARGTPYCLVLMDIEMPKMGGVEATKRLRADGFDPDGLPIIALTAHAFAEDGESYFKAGMQSHLSKPLTLQALVDELRQWA